MSQIYPLIKAASQFFLHASMHVTLWKNLLWIIVWSFKKSETCHHT
jgi:hypothetical protein